jgi:hypothetical protein
LCQVVFLEIFRLRVCGPCDKGGRGSPKPIPPGAADSNNGGWASKSRVFNDFQVDIMYLIGRTGCFLTLLCRVTTDENTAFRPRADRKPLILKDLRQYVKLTLHLGWRSICL